MLKTTCETTGPFRSHRRVYDERDLYPSDRIAGSTLTPIGVGSGTALFLRRVLYLVCLFRMCWVVHRPDLDPGVEDRTIVYPPVGIRWDRQTGVSSQT